LTATGTSGLINGEAYFTFNGQSALIKNDSAGNTTVLASVYTGATLSSLQEVNLINASVAARSANFNISYREGEITPTDMMHIYSQGGFYMKIYDDVAATNRFHRFDDSGKVGFNSSTAPTYHLEVNGSQKIISGALGVNVNPNATAGRIDASNDVVAYSSDKRLKTNIKPIENSLDKVLSLKGFTYNWNELAKEVANFNTEESLVGVFAQEIKDVLPEAVKLAPFDNDGNDNSKSGENYLTVQYEKIVPLLIEAIKEQQNQINELKKIIENGTNS
jgi:hypothetical protein